MKDNGNINMKAIYVIFPRLSYDKFYKIQAKFSFQLIIFRPKYLNTFL